MAIFYNPPANIDDFNRGLALAAQLCQAWHDFIAGATRGRDEHVFYDASK